jgi:hypothetical protein
MPFAPNDEKVQPQWSAWMADCCRLQRLVVSHHCVPVAVPTSSTGDRSITALATDSRHQHPCYAAEAACAVYHEREPLSKYALNHLAAHMSKQQIFDRRSAVEYCRNLAVRHGLVNLDASESERSCDGSLVQIPCCTAFGGWPRRRLGCLGLQEEIVSGFDPLFVL